MTGEIIPAQMTDMLVFTDEQIAKAGELLGCQVDRASCIKALIIQQDTGLSMARGEISIVPFKGKPQVFINRQGYLAYANRQEVYDGFESGTEEVNGRLTAWCRVWRKDRRFPASVRILMKEFKKSSPVWEQMPEYMLEKTAISLALRQAFPVLNGTLTEEEIDAPYTIARRPDDIDVTPSPVPEKLETQDHTPEEAATKPAESTNSTNGTKDTKDTKDTQTKQAKIVPQAETKPPKCVYSPAQIESIIGNIRNQGLKVPKPEFIVSAKMPDGMYNGDIINAEYTRLINLKKEQAKEPVKEEPKAAPAQEPAAPSMKTPESKCPVCGKPSMTADEAKQLECLADTKIFEHTLCKDCATKWWNERQEAQKKLDEKMPKCVDCGKRITEDEARRSIEKFGQPVCPECWIKRYKKE